jgi:hypothetical protein
MRTNRIYNPMIPSDMLLSWVDIKFTFMIINFSKIIKVNAIFNFELIVSIIINLLFVIVDEDSCTSRHLLKSFQK